MLCLKRNYNYQFACNLDPANESDSGCSKTFFDVFKNGLQYSSSNFETQSNGRLGMAFIVSGLFTLYVSTSILVFNKKEEKGEMFNHSVRECKSWKRSYYILFCLLVNGLVVCLVVFSFTNNYSFNTYIYIACFKVAQMGIESFLEQFIEDNLMLSSLGCQMTFFYNLSSLGNNTFLDFLFSFFVDLGI